MRATAIGLMALLCLLYQTLEAQGLLPPPPPAPPAGAGPPPAPPVVSSGSAIEGQISNNVLQLTYYRPGPFADLKDYVDYGALVTTRPDFVASGTLLFQIDSFYIPNFTWAAGPKVYLAWMQGTGKTNVAGIGAGAAARLEILHSLGLAVFGDAYYAPEVLIFGQSRRIYEFTGGGEILLSTNLTVQVGYKYFEVNLENQSSARLSNNVFVGMRWHFQ